MNINILRYSLFGIAGGQEVDRLLLNLLVEKQACQLRSESLLRKNNVIRVNTIVYTR